MFTPLLSWQPSARLIGDSLDANVWNVAGRWSLKSVMFDALMFDMSGTIWLLLLPKLSSLATGDGRRLQPPKNKPTSRMDRLEQWMRCQCTELATACEKQQSHKIIIFIKDCISYTLNTISRTVHVFTDH